MDSLPPLPSGGTRRERRGRETIPQQMNRNPVLVAIGTIIGAAAIAASSAAMDTCAAKDIATETAGKVEATRTRQDRADVELDAAYQVLAEKLVATSKAAEELAAANDALAARIEKLEAVVKAGLGKTPAGRGFDPPEGTPAPDVPIEEVTAPLPPSPSAAAAATTPKKRKE